MLIVERLITGKSVQLSVKIKIVLKSCIKIAKKNKKKPVTKRLLWIDYQDPISHRGGVLYFLELSKGVLNEKGLYNLYYNSPIGCYYRDHLLAIYNNTKVFFITNKKSV